MDFWTLSFAVEADNEHGLLTPRVRIEGGTPFTSGVVGVGVVDPDGTARGAVYRPLRPEEIGTELRLRPIPLPEGILMEEALRGGWDIVVQTDGLDRIRWRRYLQVETPLGSDAEVVLAGPAEETRTEAEADSSGRTVERTLVELGHLSERHMLERYAEVTGCELLDLDDYPIDPEAVARIPEEVVRHCGLLAVGYRGGLLTVAMSDPQNLDVIQAIERCITQPYIALATRDDILRALDRVSLVTVTTDDEGVVNAGT